MLWVRVWVWVHVVCVGVSQTISTQKTLAGYSLIHMHTREGFVLHGDGCVTVAFAKVLDYTQTHAGQSHTSTYQRRIWSAWG